MPQALAVFLTPLLASVPGLGGIVSFLSTGIGSALLTAGFSIGLNFLAQLLLRPKAPRPEDVQNNVRNSTQPRNGHRGIVKTGGTMAFAESKDGDLHKVLACGHGEAAEILEYWIDSTKLIVDPVTALATADLTDDPDGEDPYKDKLEIRSRIGTDTQTAYAELTAAFPEWTADHRGDGILSLYTIQRAVKASKFSSIFPNGFYTNYRMLIKGAKLWQPEVSGSLANDKSTWAWSDNAAHVILDYLWHPDGMRLPLALLTTPQALQGWIEAAAVCNEDVLLKAGGTEKRYRCWGTYTFEERPADVLSRMLACCDGRLRQTRDGGLTLKVGKWVEPTVTLDSSVIVSFDGFGKGRDILETANVIRATYTSPDHDYQSTEAQPWENAADLVTRGEIPTSVDFVMSPSHAQTRRLMKRLAYKVSPDWVGTFICNMKGMQALEEDVVIVKLPEFNLDTYFQVDAATVLISSDGTPMGVSLKLTSTTPAIDEWDAATEEGTAPAADETDVDREVPDVNNFTATVVRRTINGVVVPYVDLVWTAGNDSLTAQIEWKESADANWQRQDVLDKSSLRVGPLTDGVAHDFRARWITSKGREGAWTTTVTLLVVADDAAPGPVTGVTKTGSTGQVALGWTAPNSANYAAAHIYRNALNDKPSATLIRTEYGAPSSADTFTNTGLAAGTYYFWIAAMNGSGVEATAVATGSVTVT